MENRLSTSSVDGKIDKRTPRRKQLKKALASYNDQSISLEVVLRDLSETGVKLKLNADDPLPDHFTLFVQLDGILVDCEVVWRRGLEIGARFVSEIKQSKPTRVQNIIPTTAHRKATLRKRT